MFISYDRSIVEEYTFGENRIVSVGPIEAQRVSGWHGNRFVVETLDTTDTILFETWYLESEGSVLVRDIRLAKTRRIATHSVRYSIAGGKAGSDSPDNPAGS